MKGFWLQAQTGLELAEAGVLQFEGAECLSLPPLQAASSYQPDSLKLAP